MRSVLMWGSRNLTWKHLWLTKLCLDWAQRANPPDLAYWLEMEAGRSTLPIISETLRLIHGDGPPGDTPGAVGADKLAELAAMEVWPEGNRRIRRFRVAPVADESWGHAAARRDVAMAEARPDVAICLHTDLDRSKGSIITAHALQNRALHYWYCRVTQSGSLVAVEER